MPRSLRVFAEGAMYHVYSRVTRRERVFADPEEAAEFVEVLREVKRRDGLVLYAWCLMPSHYHLLLRTIDVPLSRSMASIQVGFTKRFNRRHGLIGPLWQGRYKAKLVEEQRYFDRLVVYVHLNPVAAGLVADPADYRWSGHLELLGKTRRPVVDVDETLQGFGRERRSARRAYVRALEGADGVEWVGGEPGRLPWWRFGRLPKEDEEEIEASGDRVHVDALGRSTGRERPRMEVTELLERASVVLGVRVGEMAGEGRARRVVRAREAVALVAVERYVVRAAALSRALGKGPDTVSRWLWRAARRRREDEAFAEVIDALDAELAKPLSNEPAQ